MMEESISVVKTEESMDIPEHVNFLTFAAERQNEIKDMETFISNPITTKLIFQKLPPHMRRRVMSHNSKRLPIRFRSGHMSQLAKSGQPPVHKRPSRKYRRRPRNLLQEYNRRQRNKFWLETHIWHAKRFHMVERWGYKLAEAPCNKAFKACYRATSEHCLLQDISYYSCIELSGELDKLLAGFKTITNKECGLTFAAKAFMSGNREGNVYIFHNSYPHSAIGRVSYLWNPITIDNNKIIWLFVHASYYLEVLNVLRNCFNLIKENHTADTEIKSHGSSSNNGKCDKNTSKSALINSNDSYKTSAEYNKETGIKLKQLNNLNRFRLTGPLSTAVLLESLRDLTELSEDKFVKSNWIHKYITDNNFQQICKIQSKFFSSLKIISSPSELRAHMVMGLNVLDPRLQQNRKRTKAVPTRIDNISLPDVSEYLHHSVLWNTDIRDSISNNMLPAAELHKMVNKLCLVPGEDGYVNNFTQPIPIILIQRPGVQFGNGKLGYGSGWDLLIPPRYAVAVWVALIMRGARSGGLRESRNICFESQQHYLAPDTAAGKAEDLRIYKDLRNKYFRIPPNKRANYIKLGINSPFKCNWLLLVNEWCEVTYDTYHVLRKMLLLRNLEMYLTNKISSIEIDVNSNYLVPVSLEIFKGVCEDFSIICLPKLQDIKICKTSQYVSKSICPEETMHEDENEKRRQNERQLHLTLLKMLKRKRKLTRKSVQSGTKTDDTIKKLKSEQIVKEQLEKMQQLWLPEEITTVRNQCSREVMGYVTKGGFSFTRHKGMCLGYVTIGSIISLRKLSNSNIVLVRNTSSKQYLFAGINIIQ